jgi:hypothetical protein
MRRHRREYSEVELILAFVTGVILTTCAALPFLPPTH